MEKILSILEKIIVLIEATRDQRLRLTIWLSASMLSCRDVAIAQVDQGPLTWAPVRLSVNNVKFDDSCNEGRRQDIRRLQGNDQGWLH